MGGLDIFFSNKAGDSWTMPVRLDPPFNSRSDDFAYIRESGASSGYFTSDRGRNDDVYSFTALKPSEELAGCIQQVENSYCYLFFETGVMDLDTLPYIYEWVLEEGIKKRGLSVEHCFDGPGEYLVQLNVIDTLAGEVMYNEASYRFEAFPEEQAYISCPDTCISGEAVLFDETLETYLPDFNIEEYYWKFDDDDHTSLASQPTFTFSAPGAYDIYLKLKGTRISTGEKTEICSYKRVIVINRIP